MEEPFPYDRVVKDIFFHDRPRLTLRFTGGKPVREIVASDLPRTLERRADMVLLVDPGELHHLEFQSHNFPNLPYRQGVDCFLLAERHKKRRVTQTVIYFGDAPMRMPSEIDVGAGQVRYRLIDIRQFDAMEIAAGGGPADLVLAALAGGGRKHLPVLLERICALQPAVRNRALAQLALLAGLRRMARTVKMELTRMGLAAQIAKNEFLREYFEEVKAEGKVEGKAEGKVEGKVEGKAEGLQIFLESKFGRLPAWATSKISQASLADFDRWMRKAATARSLEGVLGRK